MGERWSLVVVWAFAVLVGGCDDGIDSAPSALPGDTIDFEAVDLAVDTGDDGAGADRVCACATQECFDALAAEFGCDLCVAFVCDGVPVGHGCHRCEPRDAADPRARDAARLAPDVALAR
jgi:hypothetical protein